MNVTFIIGLPGSGKTQLMYNIRNDEFMIDDPTSESLKFPDEPCDMIITDPNFCNNKILLSAETMINKKYAGNLIIFQRIYFANDPDQCLFNANNREDSANKKVDSMIKQLSLIYEPPDNPRPVFIPVNLNTKGV